MISFPGLDEIDWSALRHLYGSAEDVPGLLRAVAAEDEPAGAVVPLQNVLYHQGGVVCSAATAALPYLVGLAEAPDVADRPGVLEIIMLLAGEANRLPRIDAGWPDAWAAALPRLTGLLRDPAVHVRRELTITLAAAVADGDAVVTALRGRWAGEDDRAVRLGIVLAAGDLARGCTAAVLPEALAWLRDLREDEHAQIRMAADLALAQAVGAQRPDLGMLVDAVRGDIAAWEDAPWVGGVSADLVEFHGAGASHLLGWIAGRLREDVVARTGLAAAFLGDRDPDRRVGAARIAADLLSRWRSPAERLLPGLAELSDDPSPAARARATHLLAALEEGPLDDPVSGRSRADLLAARLDDRARLFHEDDARISDIAAWGLARRGDPRCLPRLVERLGGRIDLIDISSGRSAPFTPAPPPLRHVLAPLAAHADVLLPAVRARLADPDDSRGLVEALEEWGPAAAPAVPELVHLLGTALAGHAARAIAAIGPAAGDAVPALLRPAGPLAEGTSRRPNLVRRWAVWKVTGDHAALLAALDGAFERGDTSGPLELVADLGPLAAHHAPRMRTLMDSQSPWTRVKAAYAYYRLSGDGDVASQQLWPEVHELARGTCRPVGWAALRHLTRIGSASSNRPWVLRELLDSDVRHRTGNGWRAFTDDQELRDLAERLLGGA
ncbi:hypothetical protein [Actinomadura roseirufa]|uniref:hypothetical protein n=1 Tax=Actinomadura roseirufa TaxID=2094049 RepID=UPI001041218E|nr:hypothetical protein [Actinomadura roseirufa]